MPVLPWAGILQQREGSYLALGAVSLSWWTCAEHCGCAQPALFKGSRKCGDGEVRKAEVGARAFQVTPACNGGLRIYLTIAVSAKACSILIFKGSVQTEENHKRAVHSGSEFAGSQILH